MLLKKFTRKNNFGAAIAITIGVGLALGASLDSYLIGIIIMLPLGIALYHDQKTR